MKGTEQANAARFSDLLVKAGFGRAAVRPCPSDPPDFEAEVDDEVWAVEATELHQYIQDADAEKPRVQVTAPLDTLGERIKRASADIVGPSCMMTVTGPLDAKTAQKVEERALQYMRDQRRDRLLLDIDPIEDVNPWVRRARLLYAADQAQAWIEGVDSPIRFTYATGLEALAANPGQESLATDVVAATRHAVNRILEAKLDSVSALGSYDRRILLVWSTYPFADPEIVMDLLHHKDLKGVDSVVFSAFDGGTWVVADPGEVFGKALVLPWRPTD